MEGREEWKDGNFTFHASRFTTVLSDESGKYQFVNLPPGAYLLRCQTSDGYIYYGEESEPPKLQISESQSIRGVNFRFASFKKGTWKSYTPFDGLSNPNVRCIYRTPDGILWVGTHTGDIYRFDGSTFERLATKGEFIDSPL